MQSIIVLMSFVFILLVPQKIFSEMICKKMPNKYKISFCCLVFCFADFSCTKKTNSDLPAYLPATQYSPVQTQYPQRYDYPYNRPYSSGYTNPYAYPPQNYSPYYDSDQYYIPPRSYQSYEQERYYRNNTTSTYNSRQGQDSSGVKY